MEPNIHSRYLDIYSSILQNTVVNYNQTNDIIRQVETGIRQLMRHNIPSGFETNTNHALNHTYPLNYGAVYHNPYLSSVHSHNDESDLNSRFRQPINRPINRPTSRPTNTSTSRPNTRNYASNVSRHSLINPNRNNSNNDPLTSLFSRLFTNNITYTNLDNLTPVIVTPTYEEISNATEDISWNVDIGYDVCPITQDRFVTGDNVSRIHHCGHCFTCEALTHWFTLSVYCPVCRYDIRSYVDDNPDTNDNRNDNPDTNDNIENNITSSSVSSEILTSVTRQLTEALNSTQNENGLNFRNDISNNTSFSNASNIGEIAFEYIIQTPDNVYSSSSLSNDSLSSLFRDAFLGTGNSNNSNPR